MAIEQQIVDALTTIDAATTKIAANQAAIAAIDQTVSDEVDTLVADLKAALSGQTPISKATVDKAMATAAKAQAASDASDALVPVLQAIASKGVVAPVPVPVPPAPPTV